LTYDVVVVGAGPTGSTAAYTAAKAGLKTLLLEEHSQIGRPAHCTGKITARAFQEFNLPRDCVLNTVRGAFFYSPSNLQFSLFKDRGEFHIVDREKLDRKLAERALDAGAELLLEAKAYGLEGLGKPNCLLKVKHDHIRYVEARVVVDAEGSTPLLAERVGLPCQLPRLKGIQYEMEGVDFNEVDAVELYFGRRMFPGFFGWIVPLDTGRARVGLCVRGDLWKTPARSCLEKALRSHPVLSKKTRRGKVKHVQGGEIPLHGPVKECCRGNLMLAGGAAGHNKSTSGGGIYFGLKAGKAAGEAAAQILAGGLSWLQMSNHYAVVCEKAFGRELNFTSKMRRMLDEFSDQELDCIFRFLAEEEKLRREIERYGDTDYQSRLFFPLILKLGSSTLKRPWSFRFISKILLTSFMIFLR
jgi:geranylgeranyl reductase family protein